MSENIMATPLYHQRSHSMPVGHGFIDNNNSTINHGNMFHTMDNVRTFDFKRSADSSAQITTNEGFPPPISKSVSTHFHAPSNNNHESHNVPETNFFCQSKPIYHLYDYNNKNSYPAILNCKMDRGFFVSQSHWTCYRRNYFQVTASVIIPDHTDQSSYALQVNPDKPMQPIQEFSVQLKAYTTTTTTTNNNTVHSLPSPSDTQTPFESHHAVKPITLTQMTAKRDKGPQNEPPILTIIPSDSAFNCEQLCVTFERLQFRVATANNGKRRASQQYFRLAFQLLAQLEDGSRHVISECCSSPLVVRGRSPGHYSSEPQRDLKRKKKMSPPVLSAPRQPSPSSVVINKAKDMLPSPTHSAGHPHMPVRTLSDGVPSSGTEGSSPSPHYSHSATLPPPPPPPPQYIYTPPSIVMDTRQPNTTDTSLSSPPPPPPPQHQQPLIPASIVNSAFSHLHARSQSANDSDFFARQRQNMKYPSVHQESGLFEYNVGIQNALRNWQQQVVRQRTDSATTFDSSYMSSSTTSHQEQVRSGTRPGTPLPYQNHAMFQHSPNPMANHWSPRQSHFMEDSKTNHHPQQNGYVNSQEESTKLYHSPTR